MRTIRRLFAFLSIAALGLFAAVSAGAGNPHALYTCTKVKPNGDTQVNEHVPESALGGLTNAGFECVAEDSEQSDPGQPGDEDDPGEQGDQGGGDENSENGTVGPSEGGHAPSVSEDVGTEPRSLFCLTTAPANGTEVSVNLLDSQGEHLVGLGVVSPARFYEGLGASCDVLPGYEYAGYWVDHVGGVVPGVAVYPLYVVA